MHIHSCLSPCADLEMSPRKIVEQAIKVGLNAIVVADHNSALNSEAIAYECEEANIECLFGMEANTSEEAHILCIFDEIEQTMEISNILYEKLLPIKVNNEIYGFQVAVDRDENVIAMPENLLSAPTTLSINELQEMVLSRDGLFIPSHIDRPYSSVISQLGFLPPSDLYTAVEVSKFCLHAQAKKLAGKFKYITNSDAHNIEDVGRAYTEYDMPNFTVASIKEAIEKNKMHLYFERDIKKEFL